MPHLNIYKDTNPHELSQLLGEVDKSQMALPEFQRSFVWPPAATQGLLVSVINNFPIGSLLRLELLKSTSLVFEPRCLEDGPPINLSDLRFLVLDGQQRLTSLYNALYGVGDHRYFINLNWLLADKDRLKGNEMLDVEDECIFYEDFDSPREIELRDDAVQAKELIYPLSGAFKGIDFSDWMIKVVGKSHPNFDDLMVINDQWIRPIARYRFPVVTYDGSTPIKAVCVIFEALNRGGTKLTTFELLTARLYPDGIRLRDEWDTAKAVHPLLEEYRIDSDNILQVVALLSGKKCRNSDLLQISKTDFHTHWNNALKGMDEAILLLRGECGVLTGRWVPYGTTLITLAVACANTAAAGPARAGRLAKMKRWFWCAVFSQAYEKSANSQIDKDHKPLVDWINGGAEPDSVRNYKRSSLGLRQTTERQIGLYRGLMALILSHGTLDFHTKSRLNAAIIAAEKVDDHHVFPKACDAIKGKFPAELVNCILNRTLIDAATNRSIGKNDPSVYLTAMDKASIPVDSILNSHSLPTGASSPLRRDEFNDFLDWREKELEDLIKTATL